MYGIEIMPIIGSMYTEPLHHLLLRFVRPARLVLSVPSVRPVRPAGLSVCVFFRFRGKPSPHYQDSNT